MGAPLPTAGVFEGLGSAKRIHEVFSDNKKDVDALTTRLTDLETENTDLKAQNTDLIVRIEALEKAVPRVKTFEIAEADITTNNLIEHNLDDANLLIALPDLDESPSFLPWLDVQDSNSFRIRFASTPATDLKVTVVSFKPQG